MIVTVSARMGLLAMTVKHRLHAMTTQTAMDMAQPLMRTRLMVAIANALRSSLGSTVPFPHLALPEIAPSMVSATTKTKPMAASASA
jgi:hypothetical protein